MEERRERTRGREEDGRIYVTLTQAAVFAIGLAMVYIFGTQPETTVVNTVGFIGGLLLMPLAAWERLG